MPVTYIKHEEEPSIKSPPPEEVSSAAKRQRTTHEQDKWANSTDDEIEDGEIDEKVKIEEEETEEGMVSETDDKHIHNLIDKKEWDAIVSWIELQKGRREIPELRVHNDFGMDALEYGIRVSAPLKVIRAMLKADSGLVKTSQDLLPLHVACGCSELQEDVILYLLGRYPEAVLEAARDDKQSTIFHIVLENKPSLELITKMVEAWAKCSNMSVDDSWTTILSQRDTHTYLPLHVAIENHAPDNVILEIIRKNLHAVIDKSKEGSVTPLHCVATSLCTLPVLTELLRYGTGAVSTETKWEDGKCTPLHFLFNPKDDHVKSLWRQTEYGDLLPPQTIARYFIKSHSLIYKRATQENKVKGLKPEKVANDLLKPAPKSKKYRNAQGYSILEQAVELKNRLMCKELNKLVEEMRNIGGTFNNPLPDWPELNLHVD